MQNIVYRFHGLDTARIHNKRFVETVRAGVYSGFKLRVNPGYRDRIDIAKGSSPRSVLVTPEGVIVEETADIPNAVKIDPADSVLTRIDAIVCEYTFTTDTSRPATYRVLRGKNQPDLSTSPTPPAPTGNQVLLGYVHVLPQLALGGVAQVRVDQTNIHNIEEADLTLNTDIAPLKPEIDFANAKRIYVYPGVFPNASQTSIIRFLGGYSDEIDGTAMAEKETRYFLFGISDDQEVSVVSESSDPDSLSGYGTEVLPLAIGQGYKSGGDVRLVGLQDVRFPFARHLTPAFEQDIYQDLLANSVFNYVRVDVFDSTDLIDISTVAGPTGVDLNLKTAIDRADTSLTFEWTGTDLPDDDVTIVTENVIGGTPLSNVEHFMVFADTTTPNFSFDYSTVGKYSGFTNQRFSINTLISIPTGGGGRLYLRLRIPKDAFIVNRVQKIFSYGVYLNLDAETLNLRTVGELGVQNLINATPNMIANGNFRWWSRNDKNDYQPDCDSAARVDYTVSSDPQNIDSGTEVFAADGWQLTRIEYGAASKQVSRVVFSDLALNSGIKNAIDMALLWEGEASQGSSTVATNHLEYRVPVAAEMIGQRVTFAVDFQASDRSGIGIGIAFYTRDETGTFELQGSITQTGAAGSSGTLLVVSDTAIVENTYAVGLIIMFPQTTGASEIYVWNARAARGIFKILPYTASVEDRNRLRGYYERGRVSATARLNEGDDMAASVQFGSVKHLGLSKSKQIVAQIVSGDTANRSQNVDQLAFTPNEYGFVLNGRAISSGLTKIDVEWEAFVLYPSVG
jgi:hypothetical protein